MFIPFFHSGRTSGRVDDNEEAIKKRLTTYKEQTIPVIDHYGRLGRVRRVDASGPVDLVYKSARMHLCAKVVLMMGGLGSFDVDMGKKMADTYGYLHVNANKLVEEKAKKDAALGTLS